MQPVLRDEELREQLNKADVPSTIIGDPEY